MSMHRHSSALARITAVEALLYALPRRCRGFVNAVRTSADVFKVLCTPMPPMPEAFIRGAEAGLQRNDLDYYRDLPNPRMAEWIAGHERRFVAVDSFADWLVKTYPARQEGRSRLAGLAWLHRTDGLHPPFATDNGLAAFAIGVVPWILAGAKGEPPRTRLTWERERLGLHQPSAPPKLREPDRHAEWWALHHVEEMSVLAIADAQHPPVDDSTVRKAITSIGRFYRPIPPVKW